ncbi:MAG: hypothetical protein IJO21_05770 [Oscillospiraceae bacterium]|nr:hypothetical protein [Oscillospiraceae bacterium]
MIAVFNFLADRLPYLLDLNLTATIVILFVLSVRVLMKGAPKVFSYGLWLIVLLRLLVPVSVESPVSFVPERTEFSSMVDLNQELPAITFETAADRESNQREKDSTSSDAALTETFHTLDAQTWLTLLWLSGVMVMLLWGVVSWLRLYRKLRVVLPLGDGIYLADDMGTPFVMGLFRPRIFLPSSLTKEEQGYILLHERCHIRRCDHIVKWLFWLALCIHWFNPFVWTAFVLSGRDMEMSCDEAVIKSLEPEVRAAYSASLLNFAAGRRIFTGVPLAFGEGDPKARIRNIASWKKPALWVVIVCAAVCILLAVCLLTDPAIPEPPLHVDFRSLDKDSVTEVTLHNGHNGQFTHLVDREAAEEICDILKSVYGVNGTSGKGYYGFTYTVKLYSGKEEILTIGFGDDDAFFHGTGEDGYPIRYELEGLSREGILRLLSRYDESGYDWDASSTAKRWGVSLFVDGASAFGADIRFALDTSVLSSDYLEQNELYFGESYQLEQKVGRDWTLLERHDPDPKEPAATEQLTPIREDSTGRVSIDWRDSYGPLPSGEYRITMHITRDGKDGSSENLPVAGAFVIAEADSGISIQIAEAAQDHVILTFHREEGYIDACSRQNGYTLEKLEKGVWTFMDMGMDWEKTLTYLDFETMSQSETGLRIDFAKSSLEPGLYRIGQTIFTGTGDCFTVKAEFALEGER